MKKLYNGKGKRVHPSPPPSSPWDFLAALPAAVLTLAAALSPEEKEVLAYLLSGGDAVFSSDGSPGNRKPHPPPAHHRKNHSPAIGCGCFGCYKSFWERWNSSPNNHLIHHILDAVDESLASQSLPAARRRRRRPRRQIDSLDGTLTLAGTPQADDPAIDLAADDDDDDCDDDDVEEEDGEFGVDGDVATGDRRSSVRRIVSFIGDRVWGAWNY